MRDLANVKWSQVPDGTKFRLKQDLHSHNSEEVECGLVTLEERNEIIAKTFHVAYPANEIHTYSWVGENLISDSGEIGINSDSNIDTSLWEATDDFDLLEEEE